MVVTAQAHQRVTRLAPLDEVFTKVDALANPVAPDDVDVAAAFGRVLAADVAVAAPLPATAVALRDGWAVRSDLLSDAGSYAPTPLAPAPDWVEVGGALPDTVDAVVAPDAVVTRGGVAEALAPAVPGEGVLAAGTDAKPGEKLRRTGEVMRAVDLAVLRAAGIARVQVRVPKVRIVCANAAIDATNDTIGPLVARAVEADGGSATIIRVGRDGDSRLALAPTMDDVDVVIGIGGTGMGRQDGSVATLARVGRVAFHGIGLIPGDTAALGSVGTRPVLLLPGRLDAALAVYLVVGRRMLAQLTGRTAVEPGMSVTLTRKIASTVGMAEVVPVRRRDGGVEPVAAGYFPLQALARADGYVLIPPDSEGYPAGTMVEMRALP